MRSRNRATSRSAACNSQELVSASQGGGANSDDIARIDKQIAQYDRVFQGTQAAMQDAGCFESFFIFGKALVRSPQCLNMNDRVEDARRQLAPSYSSGRR